MLTCHYLFSPVIGLAVKEEGGSGQGADSVGMLPGLTICSVWMQVATLSEGAVSPIDKHKQDQRSQTTPQREPASTFLAGMVIQPSTNGQIYAAQPHE